MNQLSACLAARVAARPDSIVLEGANIALTAAELESAVRSFADSLRDAGIATLGLLADNSPAWIIVDFACQVAGVCLVPLPRFFSDAQLLHSMEQAGVEAVLSDDPSRVTRITQHHRAPFESGRKYGLTFIEIPDADPAPLPVGTHKITFTSGSTGTPRGVCLNTEQQWRVAQALGSAIGLAGPRHLCLLPLSTLLENIGGVYVPLLTEGSIITPPGAEMGVNGSAGLDVPTMLQALERHQPTSIILLPQMLVALVAAMEDGWAVPPSLEFVAVGGGKISPDLVRLARCAGLPVYEGYGLSETASVVSLNRPACELPGSVGRPLPHIDVRIENDEVIVHGSTFLGYLDDAASWYPEFVATGDIGHFDEQGFLFISGRRKNVLISSFGRNISPEWVESQLLSHPILSQCVVFGEARPWCVALLTPTEPDCANQEIQGWVDHVNSTLPDYARIRSWHRLSEPMTAVDGLVTDNGRPCRTTIEQHHARIIDSMYSAPGRVVAA